VLTRSIVTGYLCFLPFVPSFLVTLVSSPLLIHQPPRAHIRRAAASVAPSLFCGAIGQKKERKKKKESSQKRKQKESKERETTAQSKWETGTDSSQ
jgi:flagellar biosynthesis component FlhA